MQRILLVILALAVLSVMLPAIPAANADRCLTAEEFWDVSCVPQAKKFVGPLQKQLVAWGYNPGPVDGRWGPRTKAAIAKFQGDHGLEPDGGVNEELVIKLWCKDSGLAVGQLPPRDILYDAVFEGKAC